MVLEAENLTLSYGFDGSEAKGQPVLVNANLKIERGQVLVLQGPNGSGKSTLMKGLARQLRPAQGAVKLDRLDIWQMKVQEFARKIAYVPQTLSAPPSMTVFDLVSLGRSPHQKPFQIALSSQDRALTQAALERCGVDSLQNKLVAELSGGERQRTVIAMALTQNPDYLLLDEPTASLDFRYQLELVDLLGQLKKQGLGIGLILHDLNIAAQLADTIALLATEPGGPSQIIAHGPVDQVFARETLRRVFAVDIEVLSGATRSVYMPRRMDCD